MTQITEESLSDPDTAVSILDKGLHGGFLEKDSLSDAEVRYSQQSDWIERVTKFKCDCGQWHTTKSGEERCVKTQIPVNATESVEGFRIVTGTSLELDLDHDYKLFIEETIDSTNTTELPNKSIVFVPDTEKMVFSDRAGSTVFLPLSSLPDLLQDSLREKLISQINDRRKKLIDWENLDDQGDEFEELVFRLVKRDDDYFNEGWGGSGPDQGKDGFCSISLGGRDTRVLTQAKFNNQGSSVNDKQVERSCRKAERHDCKGLILAAVKTSGDLESEFEKGAFHTKGVHYFRLWSGPEIKEKISQYPELVAEYFLT